MSCGRTVPGEPIRANFNPTSHTMRAGRRFAYRAMSPCDLRRDSPRRLQPSPVHSGDIGNSVTCRAAHPHDGGTLSDGATSSTSLTWLRVIHASCEPSGDPVDARYGPGLPQSARRKRRGPAKRMGQALAAGCAGESRLAASGSDLRQLRYPDPLQRRGTIGHHRGPSCLSTASAISRSHRVGDSSCRGTVSCRSSRAISTCWCSSSSADTRRSTVATSSITSGATSSFLTAL